MVTNIDRHTHTQTHRVKTLSPRYRGWYKLKQIRALSHCNLSFWAQLRSHHQLDHTVKQPWCRHHLRHSLRQLAPATRQALKGGTAVGSSAKPPKDKPTKTPNRKGKKLIDLQAALWMSSHVSPVVTSPVNRLLTWSDVHCAWPGTTMFVSGRTDAMSVYGPVCPAVDSLPWSSAYKHRSPTLQCHLMYIRRTIQPRKMWSIVSNLKITDCPRMFQTSSKLIWTSLNWYKRWVTFRHREALFSQVVVRHHAYLLQISWVLTSKLCL